MPSSTNSEKRQPRLMKPNRVSEILMNCLLLLRNTQEYKKSIVVSYQREYLMFRQTK